MIEEARDRELSNYFDRGVRRDATGLRNSQEVRSSDSGDQDEARQEKRSRTRRHKQSSDMVAIGIPVSP